MKNLIKLLTGIISLWTFIDLFVFLFFIPLLLIKPDIEKTFNQLFSIQKITALFAIPLMIFYVIHIFKNSRINKDKKIPWALAVFWVPTIGAILYWYHYIWQESSATNNTHIDPFNGNSVNK
jgi:hypothetical protein